MTFKNLTVLLVLTMLTACAEFSTEAPVLAPKKDAISKKIVGGQLDASNPAVVLVLSGEGLTGVCTGALIAPNTVLTAAHCIEEGENFSEPKEVRVTNSAFQEPQERASVIGYRLHPNWSGDINSSRYASASDMAVLTLGRALRTTPIPLFAGSMPSLHGQSMSAVGFGVTDGWAQTGVGERRHTTLEIAAVEQGQFIAAPPAGTVQSTCQGDSGGPALVSVGGRQHVIGVVSGGPYGCEDFTVYATVSESLAWILGGGGAASAGNNQPPAAQPPSNSRPPSGAADNPNQQQCAFRNDGECDEPYYCPVGTDTNDCAGNSAGASNSDSSAPSSAPNFGAGGSNSSSADSCRYANDNECDEPTFCTFGTDTSDCSGSNGTPSQSPSPSSSPSNGANALADTCFYARDGECDEPTYCAFGTDTSDCTSAGGSNSGSGASSMPNNSAPTQAGPDSCRYANDNVCDEPTYCAFGTDTTDCSSSSGGSSSSAATSNASGGSSSCVWANDGECDEPTYCAFGTDGSDCG